ncbi:hypothetical protein TNCV_4329321 [Trichonephila clavipes]|nr:hypothetical protein TNCV_4329321 [Trichonephila clavipes]
MEEKRLDSAAEDDSSTLKELEHLVVRAPNFGPEGLEIYDLLHMIDPEWRPVTSLECAVLPPSKIAEIPVHAMGTIFPNPLTE